MNVLPAYMSLYHVPGALRGQEMTLGFLGVEFQVAMSHQMGAENQTWVLSKRSQYS